MGVNRVCVDRHVSTFSSDSDERVFLCLLEDVKRETHGCSAMRLRE